MPERSRPWLTAVASLALVWATAGCALLKEEPATTSWPAGPGLSWQWQLSGTLDPEAEARVFVLDPFTNPAEDTRRLAARDRRLICYVEVGTYLPARPDAARFPVGALGTAADTSGSRWLDIRQWSVLEPIVADRFRLCRGKGFHAVMPAGMDGYANSTGFPLTFDDQLVFNRRVASLARSLGLSPGLTNDLDQVVALAPEFDFAVNEECFQRGECARLLPFIQAGKAVFHVEYDQPTSVFCTTAIGYGFASIRKNRSLDAWREPCPE
ncbi:endo alpha-1,4 polygalactosaminidase [Micromonospora sonneratiae]|uniref:Endo alpha-1,4 polygalactosaminidase n=1 Tax=Micromonospora sonneratiae TaxID=1184706 RepID=A0ABW3YMB5_9ACTN